MKFVAAAFLLASTCTYSHAQQLPSIELSLKEPYTHRLENARGKLYKGKYLDNAIRLLESCSKEKPGEVSVHLDLACANVGRAHLLAKVEIERRKYPVLLKEYTVDRQKWEQAQKDRGALLFGTSAPVKPGIPKTSDDNLVLSKPLEDVEKDICRYALNAQRELSTAHALLDKSDDKAAEAYYLSAEAWIKALLWRYPQAITRACLPAGMKAETIFSRLESVYQKAPENKEAALVLSDLYAYVGNCNDFIDFNSARYRLNLYYPKRPELLERSLVLLEEYVAKSRKKDALLELRISTIHQAQRFLILMNQAKSTLTVRQIESDLALGLEPLQAYANQNQNNSTVWYLLALKLLNNEKKDATWSAILRGNEMAPGGFPEYRMHLPRSLAWAVPIQIVISDGGTFIGEAISSKIKAVTTSQEKLDVVMQGVVCVEHFEKAEQLPGISVENKRFLSHAREMTTMSLVIRLRGLMENNRDLELPEPVAAFLSKNKYAQQRDLDMEEYFRKMAGKK